MGERPGPGAHMSVWTAGKQTRGDHPRNYLSIASVCRSTSLLEPWPLLRQVYGEEGQGKYFANQAPHQGASSPCGRPQLSAM